jgi:hypothetical protein
MECKQAARLTQVKRVSLDTADAPSRASAKTS